MILEIGREGDTGWGKFPPDRLLLLEDGDLIWESNWLLHPLDKGFRLLEGLSREYYRHLYDKPRVYVKPATNPYI